MVRTSEEIVEWQKDGQSLKLLKSFKPFTKNLPDSLGDSFSLISKKHTNFNNKTFEATKKKSNYEFNKKGKLPRDIEKIALLEEKNYDVNAISRGKSKILSFLPNKETVYDKILHIFEEDFIEPCSITWDMEYINNPNQDIPYYRELAPYARDIINMK